MFTKAGRPQWDVKQIIKSLPTEEPVQNPVVYRVRVIAMTCLVVVHTLCRSVKHPNQVCWIESESMLKARAGNQKLLFIAPLR